MSGVKSATFSCITASPGEMKTNVSYITLFCSDAPLPSTVAMKCLHSDVPQTLKLLQTFF